jgi:hypothetical protein
LVLAPSDALLLGAWPSGNDAERTRRYPEDQSGGITGVGRVVAGVGVWLAGNRLERISAQELCGRRGVGSSAEIDQPRVGALLVVVEVVVVPPLEICSTIISLGP